MCLYIIRYMYLYIIYHINASLQTDVDFYMIAG